MNSVIRQKPRNHLPSTSLFLLKSRQIRTLERTPPLAVPGKPTTPPIGIHKPRRRTQLRARLHVNADPMSLSGIRCLNRNERSPSTSPCPTPAETGAQPRIDDARQAFVVMPAGPPPPAARNMTPRTSARASVEPFAVLHRLSAEGESPAMKDSTFRNEDVSPREQQCRKQRDLKKLQNWNCSMRARDPAMLGRRDDLPA